MHTEWMVWAMARHRYVLLSIPVLIASLILVALIAHPAVHAGSPAATGARPLHAHSLPASGATSSPAITCPPTVPPRWSFVPAANPDPNGDSLSGVTAISPNDVWAVGEDNIAPTSTLTEHFDGARWAAVSSPNPGSQDELNAVSGDASNDVWAVGNYDDPVNGYQGLIEHWNGTSWSVVSSPTPAGTAGNYLTGVVALSSTDAWAVGYTGIADTLIEHWDGSQWSVVPSPNPSQGANLLFAVTATSVTDVWAVGTYANAASDEEPLIEHWDGTSWNVVSAPVPAGNPIGPNMLEAVSAASSTDIWAVGRYDIPGEYTLIEHWNGSAWSVVPNPSPGTGTDGVDLSGVAAISASNAWAVGSLSHEAGGIVPILEHWNGTSWSLVSGLALPTTYYGFNAITVVVGSQVMAVGSYRPSSSTSYLAMSEYYAPMCLDPGGPPIPPGSSGALPRPGRLPR